MNSINLRTLFQENDYPIIHPFASNRYYERLSLERGNGIYLYDTYNNEYIDSVSGLWNVSLGHNNRNINNAMINQISKLSYCNLFDYTNSTAVKFAHDIIELTNNHMSKVIYACSGSEANEIIIKLMRKVWKIEGYNNKNTILCFDDSYHGSYYGSMSISGLEKDLIYDYKPTLSKVKFIPKSLFMSNNQETNRFKRYIEKHRDCIAGIIIEPILASKGIVIPDVNKLIKIIEICRNNNILVCFDEVATGFYKTGTAFYFQRINVCPDIISCSKGINSGYLPFGAVLINEKVSEILFSSGEVFEHGSTQAGNLVACASAIEAIRQYKEIAKEKNLIEVSDNFLIKLRNEVSSYNIVDKIRNVGFMISIDLNKRCTPRDIINITEKLRHKGLLTYPSEMGITLMPMLITTYAQWDLIVSIIGEVFRGISF